MPTCSEYSESSANVLQKSKGKIVVIDDEKDFAELAAEDIEEAGYEPILIVEGFYNSVTDLILEIPRDVSAVLCDQRLRKTGFANFDGSDLLANLYDRKIPAILNTQHYDDMDVPIRKHRRKIPILLSKDIGLDEATIDLGIKTCLAEFQGAFSNERKPYRNILRIVDIDEKYREEVVDVVIPGWNPDVSVPLPLAIIREWLIEFEPRIGTRLIACVNSGAENPEDLYFTDFEAAFESEDINEFC